MVAFYSNNVATFLRDQPARIVGSLSTAIIKQFSGDESRQLTSWIEEVQVLQGCLDDCITEFEAAKNWGILLEFPLLRLQKRLDVVLLVGETVVVLEFKVGATSYSPADVRQVEGYALDLRDFHAPSHDRAIVPVLCATEAPARLREPAHTSGVGATILCNRHNLVDLFRVFAKAHCSNQVDFREWQSGEYRPVPSIIEAAELLYAGHSVREIANAAADPTNLGSATDRLLKIIDQSRTNHWHTVVFVTGVPGSGKTLAGLNAVHDPRFSLRGHSPGAYLSGNTPLVRVLREALAQDQSNRTGCSREDARRSVAAEIQGLMDFLRTYLDAHPNQTPADNVVVFDEAQRAWDAEYGKLKFNRPKSEASLFLEIMARHSDWAVIVALVGGGQEINRGELGLSEWGRAMSEDARLRGQPLWRAFVSPQVIEGDEATAWQTLFEGPVPDWVATDDALHLATSVRSYRSQTITTWVNLLLTGQLESASEISRQDPEFPIYLTRSSIAARAWLRSNARGDRRCGLVASSGAKRLRAEGLGVSIGATDLDEVAHWFLKPRGDIRSSNALEVTANEYACQGLELDYVGLCWDGDLVWDQPQGKWIGRSLGGDRWKIIAMKNKQQWGLNKYRVLLTRARLGTVIWVPTGDEEDCTRTPAIYDGIAAALLHAGARPLA